MYNTTYSIKWIDATTAKVQQMNNWKFWKTKDITLPDEFREIEGRPIWLVEANTILETLFENDYQWDWESTEIKSEDILAKIKNEPKKETIEIKTETKRSETVHNTVEKIKKNKKEVLQATILMGVISTSLYSIFVYEHKPKEIKPEITKIELVQDHIIDTAKSRTVELEFQKKMRTKREAEKKNWEKRLEEINKKINESKKRVQNFDKIDIELKRKQVAFSK